MIDSQYTDTDNTGAPVVPLLSECEDEETRTEQIFAEIVGSHRL